MPVPVITQPESPRILAQGVTFALTLSATGSPTAWYGTSLPTGLAIDNGGNITGAPTTVGYANTSFVAGNASGNSSAVYLEFLTLAAADGARADSLARRVDWDVDTGKLTLVGKGEAQPAGYPPVSGEGAPLLAVKTGDLFFVSIGLKVGGVLVEPTLSTIDVTLKAAEDETGLALAVQSDYINKTGNGTAPRHEIRIDLSDDLVDSWVDDGAIADERGQAFDGLLELTLTSGTVRRTSLSAPLRVYRALRDLGAFPIGAWAASANLPAARYGSGAGGTTSAAFMAGGYLVAPTATTITYNGSAWSAGNNLTTDPFLMGGGGTTTAGIVFGGSTSGSNQITTTQKSSGGVWSNSGALATARWGLAGCGSASAALSAGGYVTTAGPVNTRSAVAEKFNGASWATAGTLATARGEPCLIGTSSAAIILGGTDATSTLATSQTYNGTAWASGPAMGFARQGQGGAGTSIAALMFGGYLTGALTTSETFDGFSFASAGALGTARYRVQAAGTMTAALATGGQVAGGAGTATTEIFSNV